MKRFGIYSVAAVMLFCGLTSLGALTHSITLAFAQGGVPVTPAPATTVTAGPFAELLWQFVVPTAIAVASVVISWAAAVFGKWSKVDTSNITKESVQTTLTNAAALWKATAIGAASKIDLNVSNPAARAVLDYVRLHAADDLRYFGLNPNDPACQDVILQMVAAKLPQVPDYAPEVLVAPAATRVLATQNGKA